MPKRAVPAEGRRVNVNTKVTREIREQIEEAAAESDRPLSTEIEFRLDQSFANEVILKTLIGVGIRGELFRRLADVVSVAVNFCNNNDFSEHDTREVIKSAITRVVSVYCWTGGELPQSAHVRIHGKPVRLVELKPEHIGIDLADSAMISGEDQALDDLSVQVASRWSSGGRSNERRAKLGTRSSASSAKLSD